MAHGYLDYSGKYAKAAFVFICHLALIVLAVGAIHALELVFHWLWADGEPLLFDRIPLKYPFQFIDLVLVLLFGYRGTLEINEILKG
jgi:hypothetical protein